MYLYPTINIQAVAEEASWQNAVIRVWQDMPLKAKQVANRLVSNVVVVSPEDPRLHMGYTTTPRAAALGDTLVLSCEEQADELLHEIGHVIIDRGLTSEEREVIPRFYGVTDTTLVPVELLAEDFYFTVRGDKLAPFWGWWLDREPVEGEVMRTAVLDRISKLQRTATVNPLVVVEAILDAFAEELIYGLDEERYILYYGIAKDALNEAQKQDRLSYESRSAPHQYYYPEDLSSPSKPRFQPMKAPLRVDQPDVTMRGAR